MKKMIKYSHETTIEHAKEKAGMSEVSFLQMERR
jgi:hypothetical protein